MGTSLVYNNHSKLLNITENRIPPPPPQSGPSSASPCPLRRRAHGRPTRCTTTTTTTPGRRHPPSASPSRTPTSRLRSWSSRSSCLPNTTGRSTSSPTGLVLSSGTVLVQTAPPRGGAAAGKGGGVSLGLCVRYRSKPPASSTHLPAPHSIWQLTPTPAANAILTATTTNARGNASTYNTNGNGNGNPNSHGNGNGYGKGAFGELLVVTLELHVRHDLGDEDVLLLTRWVWERCAAALGGGGGLPEITVGVVRG